MNPFATPGEVRNGPIIKERDRVRTRELAAIFAAAMLFVFGLLVYVRQHLEVIRLGYRIEEVRHQRAELLERQRHLILERAYLRNPRRVDEIARLRIGMVDPPAGQWVAVVGPHPGPLPGGEGEPAPARANVGEALAASRDAVPHPGPLPGGEGE
jgi:cell division protein FtsL